jgi:hypothetical protein
MVREAISVARAAGATGEILVRGFRLREQVVGACIEAGARFSVVLAKNRAVNAAIATIAEDACRHACC